MLARWVRQVSDWPWSVVTLLTAITLFSGWYGATHFKINSDLNKLIDQTSDWRLDFDEFERHFPDLVHTAVVVVASSSISDLEQVSGQVLDYLQSHDEFFTAVAAPGSESFFRDHALLYMDLDQLDSTTDRLAQAQPLVAAISRDPSMPGVADVLRDGLANDAQAGVDVIVNKLTESAHRVVAGDRSPVQWADEFFPATDTRYQLIYLKPRSAFSQALPDAEVVAALRAMVETLSLPQGTQVYLTGEITLQHEEIEAAVAGVSVAGWLAVALLFVVLVVGVRSAKIIFATFSMLAIGVAWTAAYAMLTVGEFNTLSLVFIVMFFGLGVDFALHFCLRFQESINSHKHDLQTALLTSTRSVGRAISLCAFTTAVGFLGFWPTAYKGLADLGVISAGGMFIAWVLTFTYLPAFFSLVGAPRDHQMDLPTSERVVKWLLGRRAWVVTSVALLAVAAGVLATKAEFDYSVLALKDPHSESMQALRMLQRENLSTDYQLVVLSDAPLPGDELEALATVQSVGSIVDLVPQAQDAKLAVLDDLQFVFWDLLQRDELQLASDTSADDVRTAISRMLAAADEDAGLGELREALQDLQSMPDGALLAWQELLLGNLLDELNWLQRALTVSEVGLNDLPQQVRARLVSPQGSYLHTISPAQDIAQVDALSDFITEVRSVQPTATGRPVIEWGVGGIVVEAFRQAALFALIGITLILLVTLRRIGPTLLILCPLLLAGVCTFALGVLVGQSLNMASVLVLPLIFGLGVDNGIHVVDRFLDQSGQGEEDNVDRLMHSSTPRAVLLSTLTTIGAFAALAISPHQGTATIGLLLGVSVALILLFTVFILPVLLSFLPQRQTTAQTL